LVSDCDVVEHFSVVVQCRVGESNHGFALGKTLLVNAGEDPAHDRCRHRGAANTYDLLFKDDDTIVAKGGNVRIATAGAVENSVAALGDLASARGIRGEAGVIIIEKAEPGLIQLSLHFLKPLTSQSQTVGRVE
jgi:hypothetical protein